MAWGLIALAAALRAAAAIPTYFYHPDELWQYLEPAYHIAVGPWVVAWEMRDGIRTWLIPVFLAGPMALGHAIAPGGTLHLLLPRLVLVALSLTIVASAGALGLRLSRLHGTIAGFVAAVWFELVYFAPHALSEPVALALLLGAAALLLAKDDPSRRRALLAGLLLGLAFAARFQVAPPIAVLAIGAGWRQPRLWLPMIAGGLAALAIDGAIDLAMGQVPLRWTLENVRINLIERKSDRFGTAPAGWYLGQIAQWWSVAAVPIVILAWIGARRYPVLMAMALVHLAVHSAIPHKEYRFILPTTAILVILAAIGTGELLARRPERWRRRATAIALLAWAGSSAALAARPGFVGNWTSQHNLAGALHAAGRPADTCGLLVYGEDFALSASYALYDRATPIYVVPTAGSAGTAARYASAYSVIVAPYRLRGEIPPAFPIESCATPVSPGQPTPFYCVFRRPGRCVPPFPAAFEINRAAAGAGE